MLTTTSWSTNALVSGAGCTLCPDGSKVTLPDVILSIPGRAPIACGTFDVVLPIVFPDDTVAECDFIRSLSSICGCPRRDDYCNLCPDGTPIPAIMREKKLPQFDSGIIAGEPPSCFLTEAYLHSFSSGEDYCFLTQLSAAADCGCLLPDGWINSIVSNTTINGTTFGEAPAPLDSSSFTLSIFGSKSDEDTAMQHRLARFSAILSIIGALLVICDNVRTARKNKRRFKNLYNQIVTVMAGFDIISSIAVSFVLIPGPSDDLLVLYGEHGNETTCKIQGWALQWGGLTSLFLNAALGTCKFGFDVHAIVVTTDYIRFSPQYMPLPDYVLVVVYSWGETKLNRSRKWVLGFPIVTGAILSFASIPFMASSFIGCHFNKPTSIFPPEILEKLGMQSSWGPILGLYIIPGYAVIAYSTATVIRVFLHVRKIDNKANKWRITSKPSSNIATSSSHQRGGHVSATAQSSKRSRKNLSFRRSDEKKMKKIANLKSEVYWQSFWYLCALYLCWLVYLMVLVYTDGFLKGDNFGLWTFCYFVYPLQGALNAFVFFRPRLAAYWSKCTKRLLSKGCLFIGKKYSPSTAEASVKSESLNELPNEGSSSSISNEEISDLFRYRPLDPTADLVKRNERAFRQSLKRNVQIDDDRPAMLALGEEEEAAGDDTRFMEGTKIALADITDNDIECGRSGDSFVRTSKLDLIQEVVAPPPAPRTTSMASGDDYDNYDS
jgi:hypothetical protein